MFRVRVFLLFSLSLCLLAGYALRGDEKVDEALYLGEVAPGEVFSSKGGDPPHYVSENGVVAYNSYDVTPSIRGYAGPIKVLVALEPKGYISGIRVLSHKETPNYVHRMDKPEFLGQFLGKDVNDPIEPDVDIDGISRATVSVRALADTVRESSRRVASGAMGIEVSMSGPRASMGVGWTAYMGIFLVALGAYFATRRAAYSRRLQWLRSAVLAACVLVVGLWLSGPFSILHVLNLLMLRFSTDPLVLAIVASTVVSIAVSGRFYCGWLCPFGAVAEFVGRLPVRKWLVPPEVDDRWRNVKYIILAMVFAAVLASGRTGYGNFEPYVTLFSFNGTSVAWGVAVLSLAANLRVKRFWCRFLCPVAALSGALSRKDPRYVSAGDCPMGNKPGPLVSECIRCNRCLGGRPG